MLRGADCGVRVAMPGRNAFFRVVWDGQRALGAVGRGAVRGKAGMIIPFKNLSAGLFGLQAQGVQVAPVLTIVDRARQVQVVVPRAASEGDAEPRWVRDGRGSLAKAEAAFEVREAKERQF